MGGRGSSSQGSGRWATTPTPTPVTPPPPAQLPDDDDQTTPILQTSTGMDALRQMDDSQLAALARQARTQQLPNQLNDVADATQRFVYTAGLNEKPTVLDDTAFAQYMSDNGMTSADMLSRSVSSITYQNAAGTSVKMSGQDVSDMLKYSRYNYIGGKVGGQAYGAGTYFDHTNGRSTGYGSHTLVAVLNPATARVISDTQLARQASAFAQSHPQFARAVGSYNTSYSGGRNNMSIYALAMGYNVISDGSRNGYMNVIDRAALVYRQSDQ